MALLHDLIKQIQDPILRNRIDQEIKKLKKRKKFGLVFEEHLPECTPLYDVPIRVGSKVTLKIGYVQNIYTVLNINEQSVTCIQRETQEHKVFSKKDLVAVAEFGEPIYPALELVDSIQNAPPQAIFGIR